MAEEVGRPSHNIALQIASIVIHNHAGGCSATYNTCGLVIRIYSSSQTMCQHLPVLKRVYISSKAVLGPSWSAMRLNPKHVL